MPRSADRCPPDRSAVTVDETAVVPLHLKLSRCYDGIGYSQMTIGVGAFQYASRKAPWRLRTAARVCSFGTGN
jgi:hypothetical protein